MRGPIIPGYIPAVKIRGIYFSISEPFFSRRRISVFAYREPYYFNSKLPIAEKLDDMTIPIIGATQYSPATLPARGTALRHRDSVGP
jgi:hypothetical protein